MAMETVTLARIYLREGEHLLARLLDTLRDERVRGVTVLRGIAGFGADREIRTAALADLALDLPLVVEFYDCPERVAAILAHLEIQGGLAHIVSWPVTLHTPEADAR